VEETEQENLGLPWQEREKLQIVKKAKEAEKNICVNTIGTIKRE